MSHRSALSTLLALSFLLVGCSSDGPGSSPARDPDVDPSSSDDGADSGSASASDAGPAQPNSSRPHTSTGGRDAAQADGLAKDAGASRPLDSGTQTARDARVPATTDDASTPVGGDVWRPRPGTRWQWDLSGSVSKVDLDVDVYDIDGFETDAALVAELHAMGKKAICYLSVGTYEPARADAKDFPKEALGKYWPEWEETYIDIRSEAVRTIMKKRLDMCKTKGFDAVEPDNMDMFEGGMEETGFPLTEVDGVAYAKWLANEAHARGLSIGQKNASSITSQIEGLYDWGLTEDCFADGWCDEMTAYPDGGKALFVCEYTDTKVDFGAACDAAKQKQYSAILKKRELDEWIELCK